MTINHEIDKLWQMAPLLPPKDPMKRVTSHRTTNQSVPLSTDQSQPLTVKRKTNKHLNVCDNSFSLLESCDPELLSVYIHTYKWNINHKTSKRETEARHHMKHFRTNWNSKLKVKSWLFFGGPSGQEEEEEEEGSVRWRIDSNGKRSECDKSCGTGAALCMCCTVEMIT